MNMKKKYLYVVIFVLTLSILFFLFLTKEENLSKRTITFNNQKEISVVAADTPNLWTKGLSDTESLPEEGMLFIFEKPDTYSFWMKDMSYPIDIVWIDADKKIVQIDSNISPNTFPRTFKPITPVLYVLETSALFSEKNMLHVGDVLSF